MERIIIVQEVQENMSLTKLAVLMLTRTGRSLRDFLKYDTLCTYRREHAIKCELMSSFLQCALSNEHDCLLEIKIMKISQIYTNTCLRSCAVIIWPRASRLALIQLLWSRFITVWSGKSTLIVLWK